MPLNDPKVSKVELLKYVEITDGDEYIGLFRIIPKLTTKNESTQEVKFECESVLATLLDSTLFKYHQLTNLTTAEVIDYILDHQNHKHIKRGRVEITRYFHYSWENENLLAALFSVPKPFDEQYEWHLDTTSYPWELSLLKAKTEPSCRIKEGYNLVGFEVEENPMSVFNRIYPLGAGEGVNQLGIESVNNGVPYIEDIAPGEEIKETVWVDKRFEDAGSLMANAQALLKKWKKPIVTWKASAADVSKITGLSIDELRMGKVVALQLDDYPETHLRIMKESKPDLTGNPGDLQLEIGNVQEDLGTTNADMERRQQVNELYSQGATNLLNTDRTDNADPQHPIRFKVKIPKDAVNVNFMELTYETDYFRGYTKGSKAGGKYVKGSTVQSKSTESGGAYVKGSTVQAKSTESGGGTTSSEGGNHRHIMFKYNGEIPAEELLPQRYLAKAWAGTGDVVVNLEAPGADVTTYGASGDHTHTIDPHTHDFQVEIPEISIPKHSHGFEVEIPAIDIPDHEHEQIYGIYEHDKLPQSLTIKVDGNVIPHTALQGENIELTDYLAKDADGKIQRDRFAVVEITPNGEIAQISASIIWGVFVRSHKGQAL